MKRRVSVVRYVAKELMKLKIRFFTKSLPKVKLVKIDNPFAWHTQLNEVILSDFVSLRKISDSTEGF